MSARLVIWAALTAWITVYAWSFYVFYRTAPDDFGFTPGLNRIPVLAALALSLAIVGVIGLASPGRSAPKTDPPGAVTQPLAKPVTQDQN